MIFNTIDPRLAFRSLSHRNYRLYFSGQAISLVGTWAQRIAMSWLVYRLTNSAFILGAVGFLGDLPAFLFAPLAGVYADRWNRHRLLVLVQTLAMIQALVLALLVMAGHVAVWHIIVLSVFLGFVNAFDVPTRQSLLVDFIEKKDDLGNAIALNSSMVNSARLLGPSLAGVLIAAVGEGWCFLVNAISYLAVIASLLAMKIQPKESVPKTSHFWQELKEGFAYVSNFPAMWSILLLLALISLMGMPFQVLMPVFARDVLHGGPRTLGFLMGCSGGGALMSAIFLAARPSVSGLDRVIVVAGSAFGLGLVAFSLSRVLWLSLPLMLVTGFAMTAQMASSNTVLQTIVEDDKRGRLMSFYTMAYRGMTPLGSLLAGGVASRIGAPQTLLFGGLCCIAGATLFATKLPSIRETFQPLYPGLSFESEEVRSIPSSSPEEP